MTRPFTVVTEVLFFTIVCNMISLLNSKHRIGLLFVERRPSHLMHEKLLVLQKEPVEIEDKSLLEELLEHNCPKLVIPLYSLGLPLQV